MKLPSFWRSGRIDVFAGEPERRVASIRFGLGAAERAHAIEAAQDAGRAASGPKVPLRPGPRDEPRPKLAKGGCPRCGGSARSYHDGTVTLIGCEDCDWVDVMIV